MVGANIDIFEMVYKESVVYFKRLENLEKINKTNEMVPLPVDIKRTLCNSASRSKVSSLWYDCCEKNQQIVGQLPK
jgi:hypothetical protein